MTTTYANYRPTGFDIKGLGLDDRQEWDARRALELHLRCGGENGHYSPMFAAAVRITEGMAGEKAVAASARIETFVSVVAHMSRK